MTSSKSILEIGCGEKKVFGDSIALDIRKTSKVDVIANAQNLPFATNSLDHIYCDQVIEHFSHRDVGDVLREWARVLRPGGIMEIRCPDLRMRALLTFLHPNWQNIRNIYGEQDYPENTHRCGFSFNLIKNLLEEIGIEQIKRVYKGYLGIPFIPDCLHVKGIKSLKYL